MRHYNKVTVRVNGLIDHDIESWTEHNHSTVYSNGSPLFDGSKFEACKAIAKEVERIVGIAEEYGVTAEVIGKF